MNEENETQEKPKEKRTAIQNLRDALINDYLASTRHLKDIEKALKRLEEEEKK